MEDQINWVVMNKKLKMLREDQIADLLAQECAGAGRWSLIERMHQRLSNVRRDREREELRAKFKKSEQPDLLS